MKKILCMKKMTFCIALFFISLTGCNIDENHSKNISVKSRDKISNIEANVNKNDENYSKNISVKATDKISSTETNINKDLVNILSNAGYSIANDEYIADTKWLDSEQYNCLNIMINYIKEPIDSYQHKADYFLFYDKSKENIKDNLYVEYKDKDLGAGNDFKSYMKDVTFDGKEDLLISLGYFGASSSYCAYINSDAGFKYEPTYSCIPSPKVNYKNKTIEGSARNSSSSYTDFTYMYENKQFVLKKELNYEWDEKINDYKLR